MNAETAVEQIRSAADVARRSLRGTIVVSVAAALAAWGVLFGVRLGEGPTWVLPGLVVLFLLLLPAAALVSLARQLHYLATLPDQLTRRLAGALDQASLDELRTRLADLGARSGLSLVLGIGSLIRWLRSATAIPEVASATGRLTRMVAMLPLTVGVGVPGTVGVIVLVPVFAIASLLMFAVS